MTLGYEKPTAVWRMTKACDELIKRQVLLADGRYVIFYTFAPSGSLVSEALAVSKSGAKANMPIEEDLRV